MAIERISIKNLRGIESGGVSELSALNILVGPNNCGTSTVLEALVTAAMGAQDVNAVWKLLLRRGGPVHHSVVSIFNDASAAVEIGVTRSGNGAEQKLRLSLMAPQNADLIERARREGLVDPIVQLRFQVDATNPEIIANVDVHGKFATATLLSGSPPNPNRVAFVDVEAVRSHGALEDFYSSIEVGGQRGTVIDSLRTSFSTLEDLRILKDQDDFILHTVLKGGQRPVPAYLAGDGFKRLLAVAAALARARGGLIVLEEPECFQHPRYLRELVAMLHAAASAGTQVVLSTHSLELLDALLTPSPGHDLPTGPTVHRLRRVDGVLRSTAVSADDARTLRHELFEDLRS